MRKLLVLLLAAAAAFAAGDAWNKVKELKTGTELRVYKIGASRPVQCRMNELTDDNLVVIVKKTETAIPREQIERIEARPSSGSRVKKETVTKETYPDAKSAVPQPNKGPDVPGTTTSTSVTVGSKPDFELVYRKVLGAPKK